MADDACKIVHEYLRPEELQALIRQRLRDMIDAVLAIKLAYPPPYEPIRYKARPPEEGDPEGMFEQPRPLRKK